MAVSMSHPPDIRPPSPALTNPDMILPYNTQFKDVNDSSQRTMPISMTAELTPPQTSRPSLPGAWLSEEDIKSSIPSGNHLRQPDMPVANIKSPVGRFLNTLDPKMRIGVGIEVPEYSPSLYSPTDPDSKTPEGQDEPRKTPFTSAPNGNNKSGSDDDADDDDIMGTRAEEILANAKQRLLAMENNLNRARTLSLGTTTSEVIQNIEDRPFLNRTQKTFNANHLRISSDTKIVPNGKPIYDPTVRSASALGSPSPFSSFVHKHHHLEPLNEDDLIGSPSSDYDHPRTSMRDLQEQMNNLKGKINSLKQKSREDSLRRRSLQALKAPSPFTNADVSANSPFIEHMRPESNSSDRSAEFLGNPSDVVKEFDSPEPSPLVKFKSEEAEHEQGVTFFDDEPREDEPTYGEQGDRRSIVLPPSKDKDLATPASHTAIFDHIESEEPETIIPSSPTYETDFLNPELPPIPESTSPAHEDRPDAFDYETYILNSAMGSVSRTGFHSRSTSASSTGSAATERPPQTTYDSTSKHHPQPAVPTRMVHGRTDSGDSTSTTATFATAYTGRNDSRVNSRASRHKASGTAGYTSPDLPPKSSYTNLQQAVKSSLGVPESPLKRNSFSPLPSPNTSSFPRSTEAAYVTPQDARSQILSILLRSASPTSNTNLNASPDPDSSRCWAPEDEHLVGAVIDGLVKVVGRVVLGDVEGGAERSILESIGAVLHKSNKQTGR